jgi:hypothetical protein
MEAAVHRVMTGAMRTSRHYQYSLRLWPGRKIASEESQH